MESTVGLTLREGGGQSEEGLEADGRAKISETMFSQVGVFTGSRAHRAKQVSGSCFQLGRRPPGCHSVGTKPME